MLHGFTAVGLVVEPQLVNHQARERHAQWAGNQPNPVRTVKQLCAASTPL